jgi:gliding motility-associated-like protein
MKKITLLLLTLLFSLASYSQLGGTGIEGFESTSGPGASTNWSLGTGNWFVFDNGVGTNVRWGITNIAAQVYQGTNSAYCNRENIGAGNTSEDYLVTPLVNIPTNGQLQFYTRAFQVGTQGTIYQIKIAPSMADPLDPISYTTIQEWTDADLVTTFNVYEQKIVNFPSFVFNQQVYVAFVQVYTQPDGTTLGDRWLVDDVQIVEQCFDPINLTAGGITLTTANLSWGNPSGATSWEIEIVPAADAFTGTGIIYNNATPTYTATATQPAGVNFTASTQYKYRVRAKCSSGSNSAWSTSFNFTTSSPGLSCNAPIQIATLPYSSTDNTANYSDNTAIEGSPGATGCGITGNYLNGNDVVYSYTAPANGTISVTMTPTGTNSGVFAYNSCANIGVSCVGGAAGTTATVRTFNMSVTAGQTYYFVISSLNTTQTVGYTLVIQAVNCAPPTNLAVSTISQTGANLSWDTGAATSWEVVVQTAGAGIPTGAGIQTNINSNYPTPNPLTPNTNYEYYVRADCNDGSGNFSAWAGPFVFRTLCDAFTVPFQEGFNSTSTTEACWTVLNVNGAPDAWDMNYVTNPFEGDQVAILYTDFNAGVNDDWLISPQIILTGNQRLRYRYRVQSAGEPNDFRVMLSENGPIPAQFTTTLVPLASYNNITYMEAIVNLSAYSGPVNIAWHVPPGGLDGWRLYIDNVIIEDLPTCPEPSMLTATAVLSTSATLTWTNGNAETEWQVLALPCGSPAPAAGATGFVTVPPSGSPYVLTGLTPTTCYDVYIRAVCPANDLSPWTGPATFTTQVAPPACGGTYTDPGGPTGDYANNLNSTVTICPPAGELVTVTFTSFNTEANWDGIYVYDGNSVNAPQIASTNGIGNGPMTLPGAFWGDLTANLPGPFVSSIPGGCLTFNFRTDGSGTRSGWVANVTCAPAPTCTKPNTLTATLVTADSAQINWTQPANPDTSVANNWEVLVLPCSDPAPTASTTGGIATDQNPYTLTGLTANTCYKVYVRAVCSSSDSSEWSSPVTFTTQCVAFPIPFQEGFNTGSTSENCWTVLNLNGDGDSWDMNYATNPYEGNQVAVMYTDFNNGNNNDWLISPQITGLNGNQRLRYRYRVQSAGEPNDFRVMLSAGSTDPADFTQTIVPLASYNNTTYLENVVLLTGVSGTINIGFHVPQGGLDGWRLYIDKVIIENNPTCIEPTALTVLNTTATSAQLGWTDNNNPLATQWEVLILPAGSAEPLPNVPVGTGILVNSNPALITGLEPSSEFVFFVRALCSDTDHSNWSIGANFSTKPANDECANATFVPVNSSSVCNQIASGVVSGASPSLNVPPLAAPCIGTPDDDVWFQFIATNSYLNVALSIGQGSSTQNLNFAVYSGTCGALTQFACSDANELSDVLNGLTVGDIYYIRVYSNSATPQTVSFEICISTPSTCDNSATICEIQYGNTTGVDSLGTIGCLSSSPNPTFFTIQVTETGPLNYLLTQSTEPGGDPNLDVDYAAWGPFTSQSVACSTINLPGGGFIAPGIGVPVTQETGCSYSNAPTENLNIVNAQAGEFYIILITNFSDDPGYISLTQTNINAPGAGQTTCCSDAEFVYDQEEYCKEAGASNPVVTILPNSQAGEFSSLPAGLVFVDTATGEVDLQASAPGYYQIRNRLDATSTCIQKNYFYFIRITEPQLATITYPVTEVCKSETAIIPVTITGNTNGTFAVSPQGGLYINADTGDITPTLSTPGIYTISYNLPDNGPCPDPSGSTTIEIKAVPNIVSPGNQTVCNSYTLPAITVGNYYSQPGGVGTPLDVMTPLTASQTVYIYAMNPNGCSNEKSFTVTINTVPTPTLTVTQSSCASATGTITVDSPVSQTGPIPANIFISEVTDAQTGSLTYVELFNGTGASVNLSNYRLKVYNNGGTMSSCDLALTGTMANNTTRVIAVGSNTNQGGVVPNQVFATCGGVNIDDNIRLTTSANVEVDLWGRTDGTTFTPAGQPGYTYRRLASATHPSLTWNPADWTAIDPEDYTNVGSYSLAVSSYLYSLDNGTFQSGTTFTGVAPGTHTIVVKDVVTGCLSEPVSVDIDAIGSLPSVTTFTYDTPYCQNDANPLPDTSAAGFTTGGAFTETITTGLVIDATTGEIDLATSTVGTHTVTYTVQFDPATCQEFSTTSFDVVINEVITPVVDFTYTSPVCQDNANLLPNTAVGFTASGTYSYTGTGALVLDTNTGEIDVANSEAGTYEVIYTVLQSNCNPEAISTPVEVIINPVITPVVEFSYTTPVCQSSTATLTPTLATDFYVVTNGFTATPAGLIIDANTGEIDVTNSTPGIYTITYTVVADASMCLLGDSYPFNVEITNSITPVVDFTYTTPVCQLDTTTASPTLAPGFYTGTNSIGFTATPAGLIIDPTTGVIDVTNSVPNTYMITYDVPADASQCLVANTSLPVEFVITPTINPVTTIDYPTSVCQNDTNSLPDTSAAGFVTGGTYSEDTTVSTGLVINPTTGEIDLLNSSVGPHTILYTIPQDLANCQAFSQSSDVITIIQVVTAVTDFSYTSPVCANGTNPMPIPSTGFTAGGMYSYVGTGLDLNPLTGEINLANTTPNTYTVTYFVDDVANTCLEGNTSIATIVINAVVTPGVSFSYTSPVCPDDADQSPILGGGFTTGGVFSSTAGLIIDPATGEIDVQASSSGTYTISYEVAANAANCQAQTTGTASFTINDPFLVEAYGECQNVSFVLSANPIDNSFDPLTATYSWENPNGIADGNTRTINATMTGTYIVTVTSNGCSATGMFNVDSIACVIQKGISANNDGINDDFELTGFDVKSLELFNRYGMKVYSKANYTNQWHGQSDNGDELPDATYFYVIERNNGENITGWVYINRAQ